MTYVDSSRRGMNELPDDSSPPKSPSDEACGRKFGQRWNSLLLARRASKGALSNVRCFVNITNSGATSSDPRTRVESAVRTSLDLEDQLTARTANFLRALGVAPESLENQAVTEHFLAGASGW